uniref:NADH-ubiquinone oxidoreductase chain 4 n=1 Tax=Endecameris sp. ZJUH 20220006 TaxID=2943471 RepID=A0A9E8K0R4_9HYME|nr:NADH dehydrogenase subunit 4 [Endecameris sp. ZJUH 20220006]
MMMLLIQLIFSPIFILIINKKLYFMFSQNMLFIYMILFMIFNKPLFFSFKIYWNMFIDMYSFPLMMLTLWILSLMLMAYMNMNFKSIYIINLFILLLSLMMTFLSMNLFLFYIFFEISMIPTFLLIIGWGNQFERFEASLYMFMYTIFASIPLMIILILIYLKFNSLNMLLLNNMNMINNIYMYMYMLLAFLIKLPMFFFHLWLPKAHVEAPISGSMILAAIMLKLGGYGILRMIMIMENFNSKLNFIIISFSMISMIFTSLICMKQTDMKMLVAYSSIVHMSMMISSLMISSFMSIMGSLMMMISHGLCSSALFLLVNISYSRSKSRSLILNKGLMNMMPSLTLFWFLSCIFNMGAPLSLNLFSEIFMINSILSWSISMILIIMMSSFLSVLYSMMLYSLTQHGFMNKNINLFNQININEYLNLTLHIYPLMLLIIFI